MGGVGIAGPAAAARLPRPLEGETTKTLRVGLVPNQAPDRIRAQYQPSGAYLERALGQPVELFVATDYTRRASSRDRSNVGTCIRLPS